MEENRPRNQKTKTRTEQWNQIQWKEANEKLKKRQENIVRVSRMKDVKEVEKGKKVEKRQLELINSFAARARAVRKVCTNRGGKTPGIDGIVFKTSEDRMKATKRLKEIVENPSKYKASPLKSVRIPKPGTDEKRELRIPTIRDRAVQALYHMAVDPVVETQSDRRSFGFRKARSAQDAIGYRQRTRNGKNGARVVFETDIEKCFDQISHEFLREETPICHKQVLKEWLKTGVREMGRIEPSEIGTPQGGVISPRLCNVALNGMEKFIIEAVQNSPRTKNQPKRWNSKVHVVRYADDIIVTATNKEIAIEARKAREAFLQVRGLKLKERKTRRIEVTEGFEFLGFERKRVPAKWSKNRKAEGMIRRITASKKNLDKVKEKIKSIVRPDRNRASRERELNPILRGWVNYFGVTWTCFSSLQKVNQYRFMRLWKWQMQGRRKGNLTKVFSKVTQDRGKGKHKWKWGNIMWPNETKVVQKMIVKLDRNPYLRQNEKAVRKRIEIPKGKDYRYAVYKKAKHVCAHCGEPLRNGEPIEVHHVIPKLKGGKNTLKNLVPRHRICHQAITYRDNKH